MFVFLATCRVIFRVWYENNYETVSKCSVIKASSQLWLHSWWGPKSIKSTSQTLLIRFLDLTQDLQLFLSWSLRMAAEVIFGVSFWISALRPWNEIKSPITESQVFLSPKGLPDLAATSVPCTKSNTDLLLKINQSFFFSFLILHWHQVLSFLIPASRAHCLALIKSIL